MTASEVPLSEPPRTDNSQQRWWSPGSPSCYTQPAHVSVTVEAVLAACREQHSRRVCIKLHSLSSRIASPDGTPLNSSLGAGLSSLLMQFDAELGGVACQLAVDLGSNDPYVRVVSRAPVHLNRYM